MSLLSKVKNIFSHNEKRTIDAASNAEFDKIFDVLASLTKESSVKEDLQFRLQKLRGEEDIDEKVKLYFEWENYIITMHSISSEAVLTIPSLRKKIGESVDLAKLDESVRVLFESPKEKFAYLSERFINEIVFYVSENLGRKALIDIHKVITEGTDASTVELKENSLDFTEFNKSFLHEVVYSETKLVSIFKVIFEVMSERIEASFGPIITKKLFSDVFSKLQANYSSDFVADIIKVIPERVLSLDEWLSKLSKSQLEASVKEKTRELEGLTSELEKKVQERTKELTQAYEELKVLDGKKTEFMYLVAHQMRAPAVDIKWALATLKDEDLGPLTPDQKNMVSNAYIANEKMNKTISEILVADDIMAGNLKFNKEKVNLIALVKKVVTELEDPARLSNIKFEFVNDAPDRQVLGDQDKLKTVFSGIIDNAIRYSQQDGKIVIAFSDAANGMITIKIQDFGIGIPDISKDRVGERFYRADNAFRQNTYGTGLGLFIVQSLIAGVGGTYALESQEGKGTTVTIGLQAA